jgi:beta-mannosidase
VANQLRSMSLNGIWQYEPQAFVTLTANGEMQERTDGLPSGGQMRIPANWEKQGLHSFDGRVRFQREFQYDGMAEGETSVWLVFEGVDYFARVWVNGHEIGRHEGYFQRFSFDVTDVLAVGSNTLAVEVTCPLEEPGTVWPDHKIVIKGILNHWDCRPGSWDLATGQEQNSGGIWNSVYLEFRPAAYIEHVRVTTRLVPRSAPTGYEIGVGFVGDASGEAGMLRQQDKQAFVLFDVEVTGEPGPYEVTVALGDTPPVTLPIMLSRSGEQHTVVVQVREPRLWWTWDLGEPHLEPTLIRLSRAGQPITEKHMHVGIREIHVDTEKGQYFLNGVRFFVRGTNVIPTLWLSEYDADMIARDIHLLRDAHVNGVRVCVHINREEFYTALDQAGIIAWQDFPLQWGYTEDPAFVVEAVRQIKDMVRQFGHHPSIAIWVCQNESTFHNKHILDPVLAAAVAAEDGSRVARPTSEFYEHTYNGWYYGHYRDYGAYPATPFNSEFGAQALPSVESLKAMMGDAWPPDWKKMGYHDFQYDQTFLVAGVQLGSSWEEFVENSQRYQAKLLKFALETYRKGKYTKLGGLFQFMFVDCWPSITWSVVGYDRTPKLGYHVLSTSFQPVLIGLSLKRESMLLGVDMGQHPRPLPIAPWIVNDRHEALTGCTFTGRVHGPGGSFQLSRSSAFDVPADGMLERAPTLVWAPDYGITPGTYVLELELSDGKGEVISRNSYAIETSPLPE